MFDQQNNVPSGSLRDCQDVPRRIVGSEMQQNFNEKIFNSSNWFFIWETTEVESATEGWEG